MEGENPHGEKVKTEFRLFPFDGGDFFSKHNFYTIVELPKGDHQYKFIVDGVWKIDNKQVNGIRGLCVVYTFEYGLWVTVILWGSGYEGDRVVMAMGVSMPVGLVWWLKLVAILSSVGWGYMTEMGVAMDMGCYGGWHGYGGCHGYGL